jgi:hypothetical protein
MQEAVVLILLDVPSFVAFSFCTVALAVLVIGFDNSINTRSTKPKAGSHSQFVQRELVSSTKKQEGRRYQLCMVSATITTYARAKT